MGCGLSVSLHNEKAGGARGDAAVGQVSDFSRLHAGSAAAEAGAGGRPGVCGNDLLDGDGAAFGHGVSPFGQYRTYERFYVRGPRLSLMQA